MNHTESEVINSIKFPLIVLVVFIHTISNNIQPINLSLSGNNIYTIISELISHNLGYIAVPTFFFISGYFIFNRIQNWNTKLEYKIGIQNWNTKLEYKIGIQNFYWNNLKKKAITLFLPYVIWNLLYLFIIWAKVSISQQLGLSVYDYELSILPQNIIGIGEHLINPINYPLWYVRDLICMNIIAFILLFVIRKLGLIGIAILSVLYISNIEISIPGFSSTAIFFVTTGAYMGYHRISILNTFKRVKLEAIIGFIILIILALYYNQSNYSQYLIRLYIPLGVINVFNLASYISNNFPRVTNISIKLSPIVFFIYVTHTMYLINWVIGGLNSLGYNEGLSKLIPYLLTPTITISISLIGFIILNRFSPKLLAISMGGR